MSSAVEAGAVIFDLDGTLWDSNASCAVGWNRVITRLGIPYREITRQDIAGVAGQPHDQAVAAVLTDLTAEQVAAVADQTAEEDVQACRELGGDLYPGMVEAIQALSDRMPVCIVSNCQAGYIEAFLEFSALSARVTDFECWGNTLRSKSDNLRSVIQRNALERPVFVGDTEGDRTAAFDNDVPFIHMAHGFGRVQQCAARAADFPELLSLLLPAMTS